MLQDFDSLVGKSRLEDGIARRGFIKVALGTGFAAAVLPVCAQTAIKTDSKGLTVGEVMVDVDGQKVPVYRAQPEGKTGLPVVLIVSEIFGVHEYIADVARRFAQQGYLALAPDLFVRQGDPMQYGTMAELIDKVVSKVPDAQVVRDLDAVAAWADAHGGDTSRMAITGFCWGGRHVWMYAAHNPQLKAAAAWYGRLVGSSNSLAPSNPIDVAAKIKTPVLGLYGGKDKGIPVDSVEQMKVALVKSGNARCEFVIYPNSGHAFHADYRPSYVEADAKNGWKRMLAWFKANGAA